MSACPFCDLEPTRVVAEYGCAVAVRDSFPVSDGHTLVIPRSHVTSIFELSVSEQAELWALVAKVRGLLIQSEDVSGINIGINDGAAAGQTIEHAHIHMIPRRNGDIPDPRGGVRNIIPDRARYWEK